MCVCVCLLMYCFRCIIYMYDKIPEVATLKHMCAYACVVIFKLRKCLWVISLFAENSLIT